MAKDPTLARVRALGRRRSERDANRLFLAEGPTLVGEAMAAGVAIELVVAEPEAPADVIDGVEAAGIPVHHVPRGALGQALTTVTPPTLVAIVPFCDVELATAVDHDVVFVLAAVTDPGNAGTLVRAAEAAGAGAVVFCDGSVDPFNSKTVRASAGSVFHIAVVRGGDPVDVLGQLGASGHHRIAATPRDGVPFTEAQLGGRVGIVLGGEARGLPSGASESVDELVSIPMAGNVESLNVAMAGTLIGFEAMRQRAAGPEAGPST